jgi:hypothetical protein
VTPEGSLSSRPARVRFQIAPPFWQQWWFLLAVAAAGAAQACDDVALLRARYNYFDIFASKPTGPKPARHGFGRCSIVAD